MSAEEGSIKFKGIDLDIYYETEDYIPEVRTLPNGDPGYPSEGGDFYVTGVFVKDVDITELVASYVLEEIAEAYIKKNK
jgi:hypothetical protein